MMNGFRGECEFVILLKLNNGWITTIVSFHSGQNYAVIQKWAEQIQLQEHGNRVMEHTSMQE